LYTEHLRLLQELEEMRERLRRMQEEAASMREQQVSACVQAQVSSGTPAG
jgi:cell division septum initiation protein DivIVA